jgi:hypothetical protein
VAKNAVTDFTCGPQAYDGHTGVDFRLPNLEAMRRGVEVRAAASGVVQAVRDGMDDVSVRIIGIEAVRNRFAGNAVVLRHPGGWITQYSHMRKGSIRVKPGDSVETGQPLGLVGLSGMSEFPHLELAVLHNGKHVDPFTGQDTTVPCTGPAASLWSPAAAVALAYQPVALLQAGFAPLSLSWETVQDRPPDTISLPADAEAVVFWSEILNLRTGDVLTYTVNRPDGSEMARHSETFGRNRAVHFQILGRKRPAGGWPEGRYTGSVMVERAGMTPFRWSREVMVGAHG